MSSADGVTRTVAREARRTRRSPPLALACLVAALAALAGCHREAPTELGPGSAEPAAAPATWTFARGGERVELERDTDFIAASGVQAPRASVTDAEVVFVGYGIEAPEYNWDDFKGVDVRGKVLLVLNNDPDWDPEL